MRVRITIFLIVFATAGGGCPASVGGEATHDTIIRDGLIYDGSGGAPFRGDVSIDADRITSVGRHAPGRGRTEVDARGRAVAPGFVNMLAHPEESLLADGRGLSDLRQGVTLEVMGQDSMGPLSPKMKELMVQRQSDVHYSVDWNTLGDYLTKLEKRGIAPNVASFVGAGTVRTNVLDEADVQPSEEQLGVMRKLVRQAMEEGALGVTTALIYSPNQYAKTPELIALAQESARCGGIYSAHMRSEGDRILDAIQETIDIAKASGAPAEIYHLKVAGQPNWTKLDAVIARVEAARSTGTRITADMYAYTAGATGLDAAMPPWVQDGGLEAWVGRLKDPATRARVVAEMRDPHPPWENLMLRAGADGTLMLGFKNPTLRPLIGKTLAEIARDRGVSPQDAAIDLVIENGARVEVAYFLMSEDNIRRQIALPWVSFGSDEAAPAPEGVFLLENHHPRAYGNFARLLARYVRDEHVIALPEAIRKLTSFPAVTLALKDRGRLRRGYFADVVIFDPAAIQDHATYEQPHQLATGVDDVWVNGVQALRAGSATGAASGRFVRGRGWSGAPGGGCRTSSRDWTWSNWQRMMNCQPGRNPAGTRVEHTVKRTWTIIGVAHVAASFKWYQSLFGQPPSAPAHDYWGQILDSDGTVLLCLHEWGSHEHRSLTSPGNAAPGNGLLLFFRVDDFDRVLGQARTLVRQLEEEPHLNPNTRTQEFSLRDPDGYYVSISAV